MLNKQRFKSGIDSTTYRIRSVGISAYFNRFIFFVEEFSVPYIAEINGLQTS